jgi:hypothetical protein
LAAGRDYQAGNPVSKVLDLAVTNSFVAGNNGDSIRLYLRLFRY